MSIRPGHKWSSKLIRFAYKFAGKRDRGPLRIVHLQEQFTPHALRLRAQRAEKAQPENSNQLMYFSHELALLPFLTNTECPDFLRWPWCGLHSATSQDLFLR
jgi:hypothetical protein